MRHICAVIIIATILLSPWACADLVFKCKSPQGGLQYQGSPCTEKSSAVSSWGSASGSTLLIDQGNRGHYFVDGSVNDYTLNFVIDTGASVVSLPQGVANAAGLHCLRQTTLRTGNGTINACMTSIQMLKFGTFTLNNVEAIIAPNLDQPLLGMNVLKLFRVEQDSGQMRLSKKN